MKDSKKYLISSIVLVVIAIIYTLIVKFVDVLAIGPNGSEVGLQAFNGFVSGIFQYNETFYKISKYAGFLPLLFAVFYAGNGVIELVKGKSLKKVNKKLFALAGFYVVVLIVYVLFEKIALNYRPVLMDGELEASFPSTHTLLAICFCASSLFMSTTYLKNKSIRIPVNICTWILMVFIVVTRIISGVHWATDIIGGIIISLALLNILYMALIRIDEKK